MQQAFDNVQMYYSSSYLLDQLNSYIGVIANVAIAGFGFMLVARSIRALTRADGRI